jgi:thioredoxin reductase
MQYDVVIVGGGPAGLSAALALGRACKRVLLCDAGPRRNAAAPRIHNFVTRDGAPPDEFRDVARRQLTRYPNVEIRDVRVASIEGTRGEFRVKLTSEVVEARRILLCTGMADEMLPIDGFRELWGHSIFQCPYCHGWEARGSRWGYLAADSSHLLPFALQARGWTRDLVVFTAGALDVEPEARASLDAAGIRLETAPVARLVARDSRLTAVELLNGTTVPCDALFAHPPQRQIELVRALGVELDDDGYVRVDSMKRETSISGVFASGDLTTRMQGAMFAAASGTHAAGMINLELTMELVYEKHVAFTEVPPPVQLHACSPTDVKRQSRVAVGHRRAPRHRLALVRLPGRGDCPTTTRQAVMGTRRCGSHRRQGYHVQRCHPA